jgi:hypothetical protein
MSVQWQFIYAQKVKRGPPLPVLSEPTGDLSLASAAEPAEFEAQAS